MEIIPLTNDPSQRFSVDLDGKIYFLEIIWNDRDSMFTMSIFDSDEVLLCAGVSLLLGSNIIEYYNIVELGAMIMVDITSEGVDATIDDLGERVVLAYASIQEVKDGITV